MDKQPDYAELVSKIKVLEGAENRCEGLKRESAVFLKIAEATEKGLWAADLKGDIFYINQNACQLIGASDPDVFTGKCVYQYYSPLSRERLMREILPVVMKGGHWCGEMMIQSLYGVTVSTYETFFLISDDEGSPLYLCALVSDISQQKSIENPFLRNEEKYRIITEQTGLMLCDCDLLTGYVLWSGAIEAVTGYAADEFRHFDLAWWKDRMHPEDAPIIHKQFLQAQKEGGKYYGEYRFRCKDGSYVYIEENSVFLKSVGNQTIKMLGVLKDITEKKNYENALFEANERLEKEVERRTENLALTNKNLLAEIERRREIEKALRQSEVHYRAVVEDQTEMISRFTTDFTITFTNEAHCRYFSISLADVIGKPFIPMLYEEDQEQVKAFYRSLSREKPFGSCTQRVMLPGGNIRWTQWNARAIFDESGNLTGYQSAGRDITDRIEMEKALRESEEQYRAVVEGQTELIGRFFPDYRMKFVNEALCRYFSKTRKELIGRSFIPLLHERDRDRVAAFYESLTPEAPFGMNEHRVMLPSGEIRWQQWNARAIFDDDGRPIEFQSVGRDITDRVKMEEALRESEERYRIVTKHSADGVVVTRKRSLMYVNDAFSYMCGYDDPRELIGKQVTDYIDPAYRSKFSDYIDSVETGQNTESVLQAIILRPDGKKIWGEGLHTVIRWGGDQAVLATVRDITKAKQREIESQRETTVLRRQNIQLASTIKDRYRFGAIIGKSQAMQEVYEQILAAGAGNANVVVYGESGTGKELVATAIHQLSDHCDGTFVPVNCGAIPENLMESEFFGHKKGAFTGANSDKKGFLDYANGGTLFLDEVGNISIGMQVKLLRAIEGGGHTPLGSNQVRKSDFRIIAATNRPLIELVKEGRMREDFFFRIHIVPVYLPPLRARKEDILLLIDHFMHAFKRGEEHRVLPGKILDAFVEYDWPGNVRELQNVLQRYLTMGRLEFASGWTTKSLDAEKAGEAADEVTGGDLHCIVDNYEKKIILQSLEKVRWNRTKLCTVLGIPRRTLTYKLNKYGIK
jgi:PAS domain S-box-containing protein